MSQPGGGGSRPTGGDAAKLAAARLAVDRILAMAPATDGPLTLGLGSGSTAAHVVRLLGSARAAGRLELRAVATSTATRDLALACGIPLIDLNSVAGLDITLDGADEIAADGSMIKGGGACLLWEKIVAAASRVMIAVVDETKQVRQLGAFPVPVEVVPFGWRHTRGHLLALLRSDPAIGNHPAIGNDRPGAGDPVITLRGGEASPLVTDSGHYILDCALGQIAEPAALSVAINALPGVVENGLFCGFARAAAIGRADGSAHWLDLAGGGL